MRVHHLNCGTMCPPFGPLLGRASLRGRAVCHCLLLETDDGLALIDTGLGTADVAAPLRRLGPGFLLLTHPQLRREETALAQVERLGFRRQDVRHLLPTHLDLDHAGGLSDFPEACVHIFHKEREAAYARRTLNEQQRYRPLQFAHGPNWLEYRVDGERWHGFECVRAIPGLRDEVLIVPLLGHSRGHCGIAVRTSEGWLLHAGDAYYAHDEVHAATPSCPPGFMALELAMQIHAQRRVENQQRLRTLLREQKEVRVICAHDANELAQCQKPSVQAGTPIANAVG